ncbi:MAG: ankyrin repeat domain-containing protein [Verrucomicrobiota bacterium]
MLRHLAIYLGFFLPIILPAHAAKILFIAGPKSHGAGQHEHPAGCKLLADQLAAAKIGVTAEVSEGWPEDETKISSADGIVIYGDGIEKHPAIGHLPALRDHMRTGKGLSILHFALEPADKEMAGFFNDAIGGYFDSQWSVNPVWKLSNPIIAKHPVTSGVGSWEMEEEMYFHLRFRNDVIPLLQAVPPASALGADGPRSGNPTVRAALEAKEPQTLAWIVENADKSRGFGFTPGHSHHHWNQKALRTLVLNGIAWTARLEIPSDGIPSTMPAATAHPNIDLAIAKGDLDDVKLHIQSDPQNVRNGAKETSRPPLEQAILRNKTEIALFLIHAGADPNTVNSSQRTPLHLCIDRNNPAIITALLKAGAKPDLLDKDGWTPLHHAAAKNQFQTAKALVEGGANPSALSKLGGTPLHEAAASGGPEIIRLLLENGIDPAIKSKEGVTALDLAKKYDNKPAVEILSGAK